MSVVPARPIVKVGPGVGVPQLVRSVLRQLPARCPKLVRSFVNKRGHSRLRPRGVGCDEPLANRTLSREKAVARATTAVEPVKGVAASCDVLRVHSCRVLPVPIPTVAQFEVVMRAEQRLVAHRCEGSLQMEALLLCPDQFRVKGSSETLIERPCVSGSKAAVEDAMGRLQHAAQKGMARLGDNDGVAHAVDACALRGDAFANAPIPSALLIAFVRGHSKKIAVLQQIG
eukprot:scaffold2592_cov72-Phaeocystis_antarctica.AAC.4